MAVATTSFPSQVWSAAAAATTNATKMVSLSPRLEDHTTSPSVNPRLEDHQSSFRNNQSYGVVDQYYKAKYDLPTTLAICIVLGAIDLATVLGNVFVIVTILVEKSLQGVANFLILSLAMTDLLVAISVTPISLIYEVSISWFLGNRVCDAWISVDILFCTSSILHLVVISFDRYRAVSSIEYSRSRSGRKIICMLIIVWVLSLLSVAPPLFVQRKDADTAEKTGICMFNQYIIASAFVAFWVPVVLMLVINYKIYQAAKTTIRKTNLETPRVKLSTVTDRYLIVLSKAGDMKDEPPSQSAAEDPKKERQDLSSDNADRLRTTDNARDSKELLRAARERKAARVIGIVCGTFVVCWLPFFIMVTVTPLCGASCHIPPPLESFLWWLGYANSCLNPIIYTVFNPSFRAAFHKMVVCRIKSGN